MKSPMGRPVVLLLLLLLVLCLLGCGCCWSCVLLKALLPDVLESSRRCDLPLVIFLCACIRTGSQLRMLRKWQVQYKGCCLLEVSCLYSDALHSLVGVLQRLELPEQPLAWHCKLRQPLALHFYVHVLVVLLLLLLLLLPSFCAALRLHEGLTTFAVAASVQKGQAAGAAATSS
jgi:fumarate reductase subunit D